MKKWNKIMAISLVMAVLLLTGCGNARNQQASEADAPVSDAEVAASDTERILEETVQTESESQEEAKTEAATEESMQPQPAESERGEEEEAVKMNVTVGKTTFTATLMDNEAVEALVEMMENEPVVIQMSDYSGFEKVGPLGRSLPTSNNQTTTQVGDIMLYQGNQIVIFYGTNAWSYTRIGHIDDLTSWENALGSGDVTVTFSLAE